MDSISVCNSKCGRNTDISAAIDRHKSIKHHECDISRLSRRALRLAVDFTTGLGS